MTPYEQGDDMLERLIQMISERSFQMSDTPSFKLASGKLSKYYVNCRLVTIDPEGMHLIGSLIYDRIQDGGIEAIGGPVLGAVPIVDAVSMTAYQKGKFIKPFYVREQAKDHGIGRKIEGNIKKGERAVVVDDVITTGASTIRAIESARSEGLVVVKVVTLVDREEGGREEIMRQVEDVESLVTMSTLVQRAGKR
jgi:orotate phosphoribosyltransferase